MKSGKNYVIIKCDLGVAQVVARYLGVVEAVGSSPVTQTMMTVEIGFSPTSTVIFYAGVPNLEVNSFASAKLVAVSSS